MSNALDMEFLDELWKTPRRINNFIKLAKKEIVPIVAQTPYTVVAKWGRVRLLKYSPEKVTSMSPVLMIPSIINKYYVLDLAPGQSFVEYLINSGIPVYMLDWGEPGPQDKYTTLENHILGWLDAAVRKACKDAGVPKIHLLGYCVGGTFCSIYTALRPKRVAGYIALAAPVNFEDSGLLSFWSKVKELDIDRLCDQHGNIKSEFLQQSFDLLIPLSSMTKTRNFFDQMWNDKFLEKYLTLDKWLTDNVDFPSESYRQHIKDLYQQNKLIKGEFYLGGEQVDLSKIECPILNLISESDHIVPNPSAAMLNDVVSSKDKTLKVNQGGHIGLTVGRTASTGVWKYTEEWLKARPIKTIN